MNENKLEFNNISFRYAENKILDRISGAAHPGKVLFIGGQNGSGKSTLLRMLAGVNAPEAGEIKINNVNLANNLKLKSKIGYLPEKIEFPHFMSAEKLLSLFYKLHGYNSREILPKDKAAAITKILKKWGLFEVRARRLSKFSKGMTQRCALAVMELLDPAILIMDEPRDGLDEAGAEMFKNYIKESIGRRRTLIIATHGAESAGIPMGHKTRAILKDGKIKFTGVIQ